jgi:hypothetical protein
MKRWDGRIFLAILLAGILAFTVWAARSPENHRWWEVLGVYQLSPPYLDWSVLPAARQSQLAGYDPLVVNPYDVLHRAPPYPRLWMDILRLLGMTPRGLLDLAPWVVGLFLLSLLLLAPPMGIAGSLPYAAAFLSSAVLLGVERGNSDLLVFVLVAAAILLARRGRWGVAAAAVPALAAAALKLYPIATLAFLAGKRKREALLAGGLSALLFLAYLVAAWADVVRVSRSLDSPGLLSFGIRVLPVAVGRFLGFVTGSSLIPPVSWALPAAVLLSAGALAALIRGGWAAGISRAAQMPGSADGLRAAAAIYLVTFVAGNSYDYRMIFLLPALPALLAAGCSHSRGTAAIARAALVALALALWGGAPIIWLKGLHNIWLKGVNNNFQAAVILGAFLVKTVATWVLAVILAAAFLSGLPDWLGGGWIGSLARRGARDMERGGTPAAPGDAGEDEIP